MPDSLFDGFPPPGVEGLGMGQLGLEPFVTCDDSVGHIDRVDMVFKQSRCLQVEQLSAQVARLRVNEGRRQGACVAPGEEGSVRQGEMQVFGDQC